MFHLPSGDATNLESHGLSKISVWNYNRGIKVSHWEARSEHSVTCNSAQQHNMHCYCFIVIDLSTYMYGKKFVISLASIVTDKKTKTSARQEVITLNTFSRIRLRKS